MKKEKTLFAGAAKKVINCAIGDTLSGQFNPRVCEYIRDDLEANILYLVSGEKKIVLANLDHLGVFSSEFIEECTKSIASKANVPMANILIFSTHTHAGPYAWDIGGNTINSAHLKKTLNALTQGTKEAVQKAVPAQAAAVLGKAQIGQNRRYCWSDGSHTMHGNSEREDFIGLEGPNDPSQAVLALKDIEGNYLAIAHNNAAHPTCVGCGNFASADFPGEARQQIRSSLKTPALPILYLQGASGDIGPYAGSKAKNMNAEERLKKCGTTLARETLRLLNKAKYADSPELNIENSIIEASVRLPTPKMLKEAQKVIADENAKQTKRTMSKSRSEGQLRIYEEFKDDPIERLPLTVLNIGDFAAAFLPGELYSQFGLDIKRRSNFPITAVVQLTGAYRCGYIPTTYGFIGGGYSADLAYSCRCEEKTGYKIVEEISKLLYKIKKKDEGKL